MSEMLRGRWQMMYIKRKTMIYRMTPIVIIQVTLEIK